MLPQWHSAGCTGRIAAEGIHLPLLPLHLRHTLRVLGRNPGFTAVAVLSLALGIGANTAIFTLINALLLRSLPVPHPEQLAELSVVKHGAKIPFSYPMYREVERAQQVFSALVAWSPAMPNTIELNGRLAQHPVQGVSGNYYAELAVSALLGRLITPADADVPSGSGAPVAVAGYEFWQSQLGGSPDVVGKLVRIEDQPFTIIGVTRPWFTGMSPGTPAALTIPITAMPLLGSRGISLEERSILWLHLTGRLKPDVTLAQARAQLQSIWPGVLVATVSTDLPGLRQQTFLSMGLDVSSAATGVAEGLRQDYTRPLYLLAGIVGLILLLACINLANLLLARAVARAQEMSVRVTLGAGRWVLAGHALTEGLLLSFAGALAGLVFARWGSEFLVSLLSPEGVAPLLFDLRPDARVLLATAGVAILTGALCALAPAWRAWRQAPAGTLHHGARSIAPTAGALGKSLIVAQVALSLVLLLGAGLLVRTFQKLSSEDLGFEKDHLLEVELNPRPGARHAGDPQPDYLQVIRRVNALPGVLAASLSNQLLPAGEGWSELAAPASAPPGPATGVMANAAFVTPGFFQTLGIRVLQGRDFDWQDDRSRPEVVILSRHLADRLFTQGDVLGQRLRYGVMLDHQSLEIVGVVEDARLFQARGPALDTLYLPALQHRGQMEMGGLLLRAQGPPLALARSVAREVEGLGRDYVLGARTAAQVAGAQLLLDRALAILSGFFAGLALLLAAVGLFGLLSHAVARRTREIGIRSALGAQRAAILRGVLREALQLVLLGVALGIPCALALSRLISGMLFGVTPADPVTLAAAVLLLLAAALAAGYLPARRAAGIDPIVALRAE